MKYELKEIIIKKQAFLLDYLFEIYPNYSKKLVKKILSSKRVFINGKVETKFDRKLNNGDLVLVFDRVIPYKDTFIPIVYEDESLVVINKPSKLLTISDLNEKEITAYHLVSSYVKEKNKNNKIFVVHRLDKDTSGLLIFSKGIKVKKILQDNWDELVLKRGYIALVEGILEKNTGTITSYLKETKTHLVYSTKNDGKKAITHYSLIKKVNDKSLVQIYIDTGRKNQIRVHMKDINHPIVGDKKYGNGGKKLCLCASYLEFMHPIKKEIIKLHIRCDFE